jgi:hypothetical protein
MSTENKTERKKVINHEELTSSGFWVGHILMIIATVAGVYLAAQQGLSQAILYNQFDSIQNNYHLRRSLYDEVSENVRLLSDFDEKFLSKNVSGVTLKLNQPTIENYIWETMKFSPQTLETPSYFLTSVRRFYQNSSSILDRVQTGKLGASNASRLLRVELQKMQQKVLPKLNEDIQKLAQQLEQKFDFHVL